MLHGQLVTVDAVLKAAAINFDRITHAPFRVAGSVVVSECQWRGDNASHSD
jgi:hypothetical protein